MGVFKCSIVFLRTVSGRATQTLKRSSGHLNILVWYRGPGWTRASSSTGVYCASIDLASNPNSRYRLYDYNQVVFRFRGIDPDHSLKMVILRQAHPSSPVVSRQSLYVPSALLTAPVPKTFGALDRDVYL